MNAIRRLAHEWPSQARSGGQLRVALALSRAHCGANAVKVFVQAAVMFSRKPGAVVPAR
jgi:hypothetical protein